MIWSTKRGLWLWRVLLLLMSPLLAADNETYVRTSLDNGLEILIQPVTSPLTTLQLVFRYGAFVEHPGENGWSRLHSRMFLRSSDDSLGQSRFHEQARSVGVDYRSHSREEWTALEFTLNPESLESGLELLLQTARKPPLDRAVILREREMLLQSLTVMEADPEFRLRRAADRLLWGAAFAQKDLFGDHPSLQAASAEQLRLLQLRYIVPNNALLIVAGEVDPENALNSIEEIFGTWERGYDPFETRPLPGYFHLVENRDTVLVGPMASAEILLAWQGPSQLEDRDGVVAAAACAALLNLQAGRFQTGLVHNGLLVRAKAEYRPRRNIGPFTIRATAPLEQVQQAVNALRLEVELFNDPEYFPRRDLANALAGLELQAGTSRDDLWSHVEELAAGWALDGREYYPAGQDSAANTTMGAVRRCFSNYLVGQPLVTAVLVDESTARDLALTEDGDQ
ncbi:MAG: insulinase family protein [Candidatus Neomarinimicrobiota bacterium]